MSNESVAPQPPKRKASAAGLDGAIQHRAVKRRASKACQCCRARKVRCNVTEHGAPCTNCRLDEVDCIVSESRRKKKWNKDGEALPEKDTSAGKKNTTNTNARKLASRNALDGVPYSAVSGRKHKSHDQRSLGGHVPHSICQYAPKHVKKPDYSRIWIDQSTGQRLNLSLQALNRRLSITNAPTISPFPTLAHSPASDHAFFAGTSRTPGVSKLPYFIKPLPSRIGPEEVAYLEQKGALTVPPVPLRNELLRAYIEWVHPYMPLLDLYDFIRIVDTGSGVLGRISLILFQAVMFAGSAFVDMEHLHSAGYTSRKEARKHFFQKTRLLYDFDYETDRLSIVQALLLLTYYYETPDDQKDTWHWMGVAISVAHTIGLHRNPERSSMDAQKIKLWKRVWWSIYMRDRLIALGMRRPARIKTEDFNVPMLTIDDFDLVAIPDSVSCVPPGCTLAGDIPKQTYLAVMCIETAKLCLCISHVLNTQYCVLNNNHGIVNDRTTMMLLPKKGNPETSEVQACDDELQRWVDELPEEAKYREELTGDATLDLHRNLLHMAFFTTLSALHRPQVLPSSPLVGSQSTTPASPSPDAIETSRKAVRRAATAITQLAHSLDQADLVRFLPTTGVTALLPAIIIHLLDIKAPDDTTRRQSLRGFYQCMQVMSKLRDQYAAADYSTAFLEAAIKKAGIQLPPGSTWEKRGRTVSSVEDLVEAGRKLDMPHPYAAPAGTVNPRTLTPPPDMSTEPLSGIDMLQTTCPVTDEEVARRLETFLASTPPDSDHHSSAASSTSHTDDHTSPNDSNKGAGAIFGDLLSSSTMDGLTSGADGWNEASLFSSTLGLPDFGNDDFESLLNMDAILGQGSEGLGGNWGFTGDGVGGDGMDWLV